jgi:hypothetical protein
VVVRLVPRRKRGVLLLAAALAKLGVETEVLGLALGVEPAVRRAREGPSVRSDTH